MTDTPDTDAPEHDEDAKPAKAKKARKAAPERADGRTLPVTYEGSTWHVYPSFDDLSIDASEAWSQFLAATLAGDATSPKFHLVTKILAELLGVDQWGRFKRTHKDAKAANGLFDAIFAAYGEKHRGE